MRILLTGPAGFIGSHVLDRLVAEGHDVVGVDNFDPFYSRALKNRNLAPHLHEDEREQGTGDRGQGTGNREQEAGGREQGPDSDSAPHPLNPSTTQPPRKGTFELVEGDLADETTYTKIDFIAETLAGGEEAGTPPPSARPLPSGKRMTSPCQGEEPIDSPPFQGGVPEGRGGFDAIIHLAAKAGVRPSIEDPVGYQRANVIATQNLLEYARKKGIKQFVFASSSSVYGVNPRVPWREDDHVLQPISPYASTKVSGELMGHVYSRLFGIRFLALRFFTVYGPRQRPDLAIHKFARKILDGQPIPVYGDGSTRRDYTYVDDTVSGILGALRYDKSDYEVVNLGNNQTVSLAEMIATIEEAAGVSAIVDRKPEQPGDVSQTWADISKARELLGYSPSTNFKDGVSKFFDWLRSQA